MAIDAMPVTSADPPNTTKLGRCKPPITPIAATPAANTGRRRNSAMDRAPAAPSRAIPNGARPMPATAMAPTAALTTGPGAVEAVHVTNAAMKLRSTASTTA